MTWQVPVLHAKQYLVIGDIHGCVDELQRLIDLAGPDRQIISVGDVLDRGPSSWGAWALLRERGAIIVSGNHEWKHMRRRWGRDVQLSASQRIVRDQEADTDPRILADFDQWAENPPLQTILLNEDGAFVAGVVHAGLGHRELGATHKTAKAHSLYGFPTGRIQDNGFPERKDWARTYEGPFLLYGHTVVSSPQIDPNAIDLDTGCFAGGALTGWLYPENRIIQIPAATVYWNQAE